MTMEPPYIGKFCRLLDGRIQGQVTLPAALAALSCTPAPVLSSHDPIFENEGSQLYRQNMSEYFKGKFWGILLGQIKKNMDFFTVSVAAVVGMPRV